MITAFPTQQELLSLFDYRDGVLYWKITGPKRSKTKRAGYLDPFSGYDYVRVNKKLRRVHRLIWCMFYGYEPSEIDHINRNRADNRIENLREVSRSENCYNHPLRKDSTSGVRGVSWNKIKNKWRVYINVKKQRLELGHFNDFDLACLVAEEARDKHHRIST